MANEIVNRLEFVGSVSDVEKIFKKYSTTIPARLCKIEDNVVYEKGEEVGFFNTKTNVFWQRNKDELNEIPDGFTPQMLEEVYVPFDFDKIIPTPVELQSDNDHYGITINESAEVGEWQCENWGVTSQPYYFEKISNTAIQFSTNWGPVPNIIRTISMDFPDVFIIYEAIDSDSDDLYAKSIYKNGEVIVEIEYVSGAQEAIELRLKLVPYQNKYFKLVDGKFIPKSEEEIIGELQLLV
jgi:hypothetical protein